MSKKINILRTLGLSEREVKVYTAGLALGAASASAIAKEAGIGRTLVYDALQRLMERGLVSKTGNHRKSEFLVEPIEAVHSLIARKRSALAAMEAQLPNFLTPAIPLGKGTAKARIRVYQGVEGVKTVAEDVLNVKTKFVRSLVSMKSVLDGLDQEYLRYWFGEVDRRNIQSKSLWSAENRHPSFATKKRDLRVMPDGVNFPATMVLYDDKAAVFSFKRGKPTSFVVENSEFTETLAMMFDALWQQARPTK